MQLILGHAFTQTQFNSLRSEIKSSIVIDNVKQGAEPGKAPDGVLCTFKATPLAFQETPTLNRVVFHRALWSSLMENAALKDSMLSKAHYGECDHPQSTEVNLSNVCNRVTSMDFGPKDLVVGDLDILDTPKGLLVYNLCKSGRVGVSSRGFGELRPIQSSNDSLQEVITESYTHVSWDSVALPAVSVATYSLMESLRNSATQESLADDLRRMVSQGLDRWSTDPTLIQLDQILNSGKTTYSIPSSIGQSSSQSSQLKSISVITKPKLPSVDSLNRALSFTHSRNRVSR